MTKFSFNKLKSAAVFMSLAILFSSCGAETGNHEINEGNAGEIRIGTLAVIEKAVRDEYNYDTLASGTSEICVVAKNADGSFSPELASFNTVDSLTWEYKVADNLLWSDGKKVSAEDILFSLEYESAEPLFTAGDVSGLYKSYSISEDKSVLTLVLEKADVKALDSMAVLRVRPKHIYEGKSAGEITAADARVSCGPYVFENFDKAAGTLSFIRNNQYPQKPAAERIVYKLFSNEDVMYRALIQGDIDFVWNYSSGVPVNYQTVLESEESVKLESFTSSNCPAVLVFNNKTGLFADINLREAVAAALDYDAFKTYFGSPLAKTPNRSFAPESLTGYIETVPLSTDLTRAEAFMKAAGYVKNGAYYEKDGKAAEFTLTVNSTKETQLGCAEFVKTQLEAFGIKVNIDSLDKTHFNERTSHKFAKEGEHAYGGITMEAAIMGYTAYGMSDLGGMYINGNDKTQGGAEVYDEALVSAVTALSESQNLDEYADAAAKLQNFYSDNLPVIALYWDSLVYARSASAEGLVIDANFGFNNIYSWFSINR